MNGNELAKLKEDYKRTGKCSHDNKVISHPFQTAEGKFQLTSCLVCRKATIDYKGKRYSDDINKVVNFIAMKGLMFENEKRRATYGISFIGNESKGVIDAGSERRLPVATADKKKVISFMGIKKTPSISFLGNKPQEVF